MNGVSGTEIKNVNAERAIYISGPMAGMWKGNWDEFAKAEIMWKTKKYVFGRVINPCSIMEKLTATLVDQSESGWMRHVRVIDALESHPEHLTRVIESENDVLHGCAAIYLLKGWEQSESARRELSTALNLGLEVILQ